MIQIECTSCKKTLDIEEQSLSPRGPSAFRCPSCNVTLMVNLKNGKAAVTGPVVRLAAEGFVPLPPTPPSDVFADAGESGQYALTVGEMFRAAETFLEACHGIQERRNALTEFDNTGRTALSRMAIALPRSNTADALAAQAAPDSTAVDAKLRRASRTLQQVSDIVVHADAIHPKCRAPYRYEPIVQWQSDSAALVADAYAAGAESRTELAPFVSRLDGAEAKFASLLGDHDRRRKDLREKIAKQEAALVTCRKECDDAEDLRQRTESEASSKGWEAMKSGGCGVAIGAFIISILAGAMARSSDVSVLFFFLGGAGLFALAYYIGFHRNQEARIAAYERLRSAQRAVDVGLAEERRLEEALEAHEAVAPERVAQIHVEPRWLLSTGDYDEPRPAPYVPPARLEIREPVVATAVPVVAASGVFAQSPQLQAISPVTVGFLPRTATPRAAMTPAVPALTRSDVGAFDEATPEPSARVVFVHEAAGTPAQASQTKRKLLIGIALAAVALTAIGIVVWRSQFSLDARLEKAMARNEMFSPAGASVYDLYRAEAARNPNSAVLAKYRPRIHDALAPQGDAAFAAWYKDSDDSFQWETMERIYEFLALTEPSVPLNEMRRLYAVGQQKIDAKAYGEAIQAYEQALRLDPHWVLALNGIGKVYMIERSPLYNEALGISYYRRAADADPAFAWAAKNLGDYYLRKDDYANAEQYFLRALAASPERPSILRGLGWVCRKTGRPGEAISYYTRSLGTERDPEKRANAMKAIDSLRSRYGA